MPTIGTPGSGQTTASSTLTVTGITNSGSNQALAAFVGSSAGTPSLTTSVTYNGVTLTEDWDFTAQANFHNSGHHIVAPAASGNLVLTLAGTDDEVTLIGIPLSDVNQSTPIGTVPANQNGASTTASVTVTSAVGELVLAGLYAFWNGATPGAGETEQAEQIVASGPTTGAVYSEAGAASVVINPTRTAGANTAWLINGVSFKPAATTASGGAKLGGTIFTPASGPTRGLRTAKAFPANTYNDSVTEAAAATDSADASPVYAGGAKIGGNIFVPHLGPQRGLQSPKAYPALTGTTYNDSITESATATDSTNAAAVFANSHTESATASDTTDASAVFANSLAEAGSASDTNAASAVFANTVSEAGSASDAPSASAVFASGITETGAANDSGDATGAFGAAIVEAGAAADSGAASAVFPSSIAEAASATDTESATVGSQTYNDSVAEPATADDATDAELVRPQIGGGGPALPYRGGAIRRKRHKRPTTDDILADLIAELQAAEPAKRRVARKAVKRRVDDLITRARAGELKAAVARIEREYDRDLKATLVASYVRRVLHRIEEDEIALLLLSA